MEPDLRGEADQEQEEVLAGWEEGEAGWEVTDLGPVPVGTVFAPLAEPGLLIR